MDESNGYRVSLTTIKAINPHPNADRLVLATVYGFQSVATLGSYQVGDQVIFVPVDSIMYNQAIREAVFPPDSKIKLSSDRRVRQIRIRKFPSQGLLIKPETLDVVFGSNWAKNIELETDLSAMLEISKYEPPSYRNRASGAAGGPRDKPKENPRFHKYNGLINFKWVPDWFKEGEEVVIQEKLHGSNCRFGLLPTAANTKWRKILKFVKLLPESEYVYGSNNVQLQQRNNYTGFYGEDVYAQAIANCDGFKKIKKGEVCYGELICEGIQKNYDYGHKKPHFVLFDVKIMKEDGTMVYLNPSEVEDFAKTRGFDLVPILHKGVFNKDAIEKMMSGFSVYYPSHKVKEGIVVKAALNYDEGSNKKALKMINPEYLDDTSNTDEK